MATKPTKIPTWATDADTTVEPSAGQKAAGWAAAQRPPARWMNWLLNTIYQWCEYLADGVFSSSSSAAAVEAQAGTGPALQVTPGTSTVAAERVGTQDAPTGAGLVGDRYTDSGGAVRTCRAAGTPGTWRAVGALQTRQVLTASSGTYTTPAGCVAINVRCWGGGGAGGGAEQVDAAYDTSAGSGGAAGEQIEALILSPDATYSFSVGAGGVGVTGAAGGNGGASSFGALSCFGGSGGRKGLKTTSFLLTSAYPATRGSPGPGIANGASHHAIGGVGGTSIVGVGGYGGEQPSVSGGPGANGGDATGYCAGGGGAANSSNLTGIDGGDGAPGLIIVDEYY